MTGPSRPLDLSVDAARRDLADITLAGRWFAPHYAVADLRPCPVAAELRVLPRADSELAATLAAGDDFAVLEVSGDWAWGYAVADHKVGYVPAAALA